jgi:cytochrome c oxidase cbb3-type subunit 2
MRNFTHDLIERNVGLLLVLTILTISFGGLVEIVPLFFQKSTTQPVQGMQPYTPLQLAGVIFICAKVATAAILR